MKPSLERTAILSKDISDQPVRKFVVLLPDLNIVLTADRVQIKEEMIQVIGEEEVIATFAPSIGWACVARDTIELVTREAQLRRSFDNLKAEAELRTAILGADGEEIGGAKIVMEDPVGGWRPGNYV